MQTTIETNVWRRIRASYERRRRWIVVVVCLALVVAFVVSRVYHGEDLWKTYVKETLPNP